MSKERFECVVFGRKLTFSIEKQEVEPLKEILSQLEKKFSCVFTDEVVLTNDFTKKLIELFAHYIHYKNQSLKKSQVSEESLKDLTELTKTISQLLD